MSRPSPQLRGVLRRPGYRRLWAARTVSQCGDVFATVALSLLALDLTGSPLGVTAVVVAEIVAVVALAPFAGTLVDRFPRVAIMVGADVWRAMLAIVLVVVGDAVVPVVLIAFGLAVGGVLFSPAANSALPSIVPDDELVAANSGVWTAAVLAQIALAPAAGVLYAVLGPQPAFGINAASFLVSALLLVGLRLPARSRDHERRPFLADAAAGLRLLLADRLLRALALGQLLAALSAGATGALLVVLARDQLALPPSGYGSLLGAIGVGAVLGPLVLTRLVTDPRRPLFVFGPYVLRGVVDLVLAVATGLPVALLALAAYGLGTSSGAVTFTSLLQSHTPPHLRGRVFAGFDVLWQLGRLVSLLLGGVLAAEVGIQAVYLLGGALLLCAAAVGMRGLTGTRPLTGPGRSERRGAGRCWRSGRPRR